jgi:hypothetical protein
MPDALHTETDHRPDKHPRSAVPRQQHLAVHSEPPGTGDRHPVDVSRWAMAQRDLRRARSLRHLTDVQRFPADVRSVLRPFTRCRDDSGDRASPQRHLEVRPTRDPVAVRDVVIRVAGPPAVGIHESVMAGVGESRDSRIPKLRRFAVGV